MTNYRLEAATSETLDIATAIVDSWEKYIDPKFEGVSSEELQMFVTGRADLVGHSQLLYPEGESSPAAFIGLMADPARKKFWTQVAVLPGTQWMDMAVIESIRKAELVEPEFNLQPNVNNLDVDQVRAWESSGYSRIQTSYAMKKLNLLPDFPCLPEGISIRTLDGDHDWEVMHAIQHDAFANHFGFVPRSLENFKDFRFDSETYDPEGIHILSLNNEDVGYVEVNDEIAHINQGYVHTIAVKHSHQKMGLGKILLQWAFSYCASKGFEAVELYVDIANKSGALKFYEAAGMIPQSSYSTFEKEKAPKN
ncbi:MAG: GNAT family N-acetyltransferase [Actinomycetes bacterium]